MNNRLIFILNRVRERLWVKPLAMSVLSVFLVFVASLADRTALSHLVPAITPESIETQLKIMSASMLVIAALAVGSMVSAYATASSTATPRSFPLVVADDVTQNSLSIFVGAFIFSILALIAVKNSLYTAAGHFVLFVLTLAVFAIVIVVFVRWVDRIARLGRLGTTILKVEEAAAAAMKTRQSLPVRQVPAGVSPEVNGRAIYTDNIGYVQQVDVAAIQACADKHDLRVTVVAMPGTFVTPHRPLAWLTAGSADPGQIEVSAIEQAFLIGKDRTFDEDPRFGLIVLAEIAGKALSPAVNDPGTALEVLGALIRLFALWQKALDRDDKGGAECGRVTVPVLSPQDMFDDAFSVIARDGAGAAEVVVRLLKGLRFLACLGHPGLHAAAVRFAGIALTRAERAPLLPEELDRIRQLADHVNSKPGA